MDATSPDEYDDRISEVGSGEDDREPKQEDASASPTETISGKGHSSKSGHLQKRRRVTRACDECRRKKIKCDGKQPCTHCTVYSYDCTYDQPSNRRRNPAPQYVENLEHRVHRAESLLHILIPNLDLSDPGIDAAVAQGWIPGAPGKGSPAAARPAKGSRPSLAPTMENKSDTNLESMVRAVAQMDIDESGNWDYHGHSSGLSFMRRMREQLGDIMGPETPSTPFVKSRPRSQIVDSPRSSTMDSPSADSSAATELPPRDVARQLCNNAVEDATALMKFIHKPSFWHSFERMYNVPPESWADEEHRFLPLLYSAMALGSLFGKNEHSNLNQFGYEQAIQQGFSYFKAARHMMDIADCRDITSVQAVICMILFMQSSAKLSQCYAYVGVAMRSALRMGLHRAYAGTFNPIELETRKRVFWVIKKMDIYVGAMLGLPQTLSDEDIDQEFPTEVDDEYITAQGIKPMPEGQVSMMTAFNAHIRLVMLVHKIVRKVYPIKVQTLGGQADKSYTVPFSVIREIESDLEQWKTTLPSVLSPGATADRYGRVQHLLRLSYAFAQVLLYRPFLHFTATEKRSKPIDPRAYACAASYVNVSRNIIHITTQMKQQGMLNGAFWFMMYTTFFSILSLVYFAAENPDNATTNAVIKDALQGKEVLAALATRSMAADRCTETLNVIFSRLPEWMREGKQNPVMSKKRTHGSGPVPQIGARGSHPDVSVASLEPPGPGHPRRASTFPRHGVMQPTVSEPIIPDGSSWSTNSDSASGFGPNTPTSSEFEQRNFLDLPNMSSSMPGMMQNQMALPPNFANPAIPDVSAMMFPGGGSEPFLYPNQPLTTFENTQQFAKNQYFNDLAGSVGPDSMTNSAVGTPQTSHPRVAGPQRTRDDNMEAQFFALPPYLEQGRSQQRQGQQQAATSFPQNNRQFNNYGQMQQPGMQQIPNGWPQQQHTFGNNQSASQNFANINIQDLFGGAEWNAMIMDPGFRQ
ncbi:Gypsy retrotransposon integrase-like protein 1 [Oleoguttula sp. CCFEE 5521]